jgi:PAT family beta-lactamase induction signal transducer AmpG
LIGPLPTIPDSLRELANRRVAVMPLLGFSSGLPLALTSGTLQAWLAVVGMDIRTIGIFSLVGLPYALKFIWAPFMDRFTPAWLGRRRGWLVSTQLCLMLAIGVMASISPMDAPGLLGLMALTIAFLSASQDIAFDAYRADMLKPNERGFGAALSVTGYRLAMLVSGALALIIADSMGWHFTYLLMAGLVLIGVATSFLSPEPERVEHVPKTLAQAMREPLQSFLARDKAWGILLLIVLYKFGDAFAGSLSTAFLIRGLGFTPTDVGVINKGLGLVMLLAGSLLGGVWMARIGLYRSLLLFGWLQALTNLGFMGLAWMGKDYWAMAGVVALENFAGGMGTTAFVAWLMALCDHRYTATQYALFSAIASVGRVVLSPASGYLVESLGWTHFFLITFMVSLPALGLLWLFRSQAEETPAPP